MIEEIKKLLKPLASLRVTVGLLFISMVLVLAGTTAQRDMGIQDVQRQFFHSWWAKIYFHYFLPAPKDAHGLFPGWIPLPGGYTIIFAMLVNLVAAHSIRFRFRWNRAGIIMIHSGLILLLVGELITSSFASEGQMRLDVGGSSNYTEDMRDAELAIIDRPSSGQDNVTVIPRDVMANAVGGAAIHDARLPFDVKVERWYDNSDIVGPQQDGSGVDRLANTGSAKMLGVKGLAKYPGSEAEKVDLPSAFVTLSRNGQPLGTYLVSLFLNRGMIEMPALQKPQEVTVDGKTYLINLRFRRDYKPYTVYLNKFTHDVYVGTDEAKDFASNIRLVDAAHHVDRTVRIWMNHPLCYNGETFYQQSFANKDQTSILQIVHNPSSAWPYVARVTGGMGIADDSYLAELFNLPCLACLIGGLGLLVHFGTKLLTFLNRTFAPAEGTVGAAQRRPPSLPASGKKGSRNQQSADRPDRYVLPAKAKWPAIVAPLVLIGIASLFLGGWLSWSYPQEKYNWDAFGQLPISYEGRILPLQSFAINTLKIISGKTYLHDKDGHLEPQSKWLLEAMNPSGDWTDAKVFRIDHDQVKDTLGLMPKERYFSWNDLFPSNIDNQKKLTDQIKLASEVNEKDRDLFQTQILELAKRLNTVANLQQVGMLAQQREFESDSSRSQTMMRTLGTAIVKSDPQFLTKMQSAGDMSRAQQIFNEAVLDLDQSQLTVEQQAAFKDWYLQQMRRSKIANMPDEAFLYLSAPLKPDEKWLPITAGVGGDGAPESATSFLKIVGDYQGKDPAAFNSDIAAYSSKLNSALPSDMHKVGAEVFFNNFDPFFVSMLLYIGVFLTVCTSWLIWRKPMLIGAFALMIFTLLIHTSGIGFRVYLTGHGPVTNLYASAIFIGWVIILLSLALEAIFGNGIGLATGSAAGFTSLLIGAALASTDGDTMKPVVAVLDTNFWLWTHVTCVTIGYASTFLAGALSIVYIRLGLTIPKFQDPTYQTVRRVLVWTVRSLLSYFIFAGFVSEPVSRMTSIPEPVVRIIFGVIFAFVLFLIDLGFAFLARDEENSKTLSRMIYGIICFALLFSFVGTILGGLWADKSWGRFWGWDPKENGAILIVLWNALILHARWSGLVRPRGMAVLAVFGNIVTSWSWFGTNMLGIGLHSYGFMQSAQFWLVVWMGSQVLIAGVGMIPRKWIRFGQGSIVAAT